MLEIKDIHLEIKGDTLLEVDNLKIQKHKTV